MSILCIIPKSSCVIIWQCITVSPVRVGSNSVPDEKQGQASGIVSTAQMIGATISVAVLSAVLTEFNSFMIVFIVTGAFALIVTVLGWFYLDPEGKLGRKKTTF